MRTMLVQAHSAVAMLSIEDFHVFDIALQRTIWAGGRKDRINAKSSFGRRSNSDMVAGGGCRLPISRDVTVGDGMRGKG